MIYHPEKQKIEQEVYQMAIPLDELRDALGSPPLQQALVLGLAKKQTYRQFLRFCTDFNLLPYSAGADIFAGHRVNTLGIYTRMPLVEKCIAMIDYFLESSHAVLALLPQHEVLTHQKADVFAHEVIHLCELKKKKKELPIHFLTGFPY